MGYTKLSELIAVKKGDSLEAFTLLYLCNLIRAAQKYAHRGDEKSMEWAMSRIEGYNDALIFGELAGLPAPLHPRTISAIRKHLRHLCKFGRYA